MKAVLLFSSLFVTISFVPFAFSSTQQFHSSSPAVVDIDGKELKFGVPYYVLSTAFILPAGLCLVDINNPTMGCPNDVVQCSILNKSILGLPIIFKSVNPITTDLVVRESTPHLIRFPVTGLLCVKDVVWRIKDANTFWKLVTTDPATPAAAFQIQRDGFGYKIAYCVSIPKPSISICNGLGFIQDGLYRRLGVGLGVDSVQFYFARNATAVDKFATS